MCFNGVFVWDLRLYDLFFFLVGYIFIGDDDELVFWRWNWDDDNDDGEDMKVVVYIYANNDNTYLEVILLFILVNYIICICSAVFPCDVGDEMR
jgi:hypothetical protein